MQIMIIFIIVIAIIVTIIALTLSTKKSIMTSERFNQYSVISAMLKTNQQTHAQALAGLLKYDQGADTMSNGSNIQHCEKDIKFDIFGLQTVLKMYLTSFVDTWTAHATGNVWAGSELGTCTTTTTVTATKKLGFTGTTTSSTHMGGATTTTTTTTTALAGLPQSFTSTTTTTDHGITTTTTTTTSTLDLTDNGGTCSSTCTTTSGVETTTTTTTTTFTNLVITDVLWAASLSTTSSSASGGVVTTTTTTFQIMTIKIESEDIWKGSMSIHSATASGGSTGTSSFCYQFVLPGFMKPGTHLKFLLVLIATGWKNFIKWTASPMLHFGLMIDKFLGCHPSEVENESEWRSVFGKKADFIGSNLGPVGPSFGARCTSGDEL